MPRLLLGTPYTPINPLIPYNNIAHNIMFESTSQTGLSTTIDSLIVITCNNAVAFKLHLHTAGNRILICSTFATNRETLVQANLLDKALSFP